MGEDRRAVPLENKCRRQWRTIGGAGLERFNLKRSRQSRAGVSPARIGAADAVAFCARVLRSLGRPDARPTFSPAIPPKVKNGYSFIETALWLKFPILRSFLFFC